MGLFGKEKLEKIKAREKSAMKHTRKHTIMIVDDEADNVNVLTGLFSNKYHIVPAHDGQEALECIQAMERPERISLIISDQRMPRLTGMQLFECLAPILPNTIRIILSGYSRTSAISDSNKKVKLDKFIMKPYDPGELRLTVDRAIETFERREAPA